MKTIRALLGIGQPVPSQDNLERQVIYATARLAKEYGQEAARTLTLEISESLWHKKGTA